ncbi:hypothetical protein HK096_011134 [Nowakowskiella sp. JEL0078]|nr:hypothetical protein HK096_011134 [Nowakowskiella sp. JEL0078]
MISPESWMEYYRYHIKLKNNWEKGLYSSLLYEKHKDVVLSVAIDKFGVISGCRDGKIKIYNLNSANPRESFTGHSSVCFLRGLGILR